MPFTVVFTPEAVSHLTEIYQYLAEIASPEIGQRYTNAIVDYFEGLQVFPHRGTRRDNIRPGLRVISFRRRTVVIFQVDEDIVSIIGIFHGGQNYEAMFEKPNVALY